MDATPIVASTSNEDLVEIHRRFDLLGKASAWLDENFDRLVLEHGDAWIAYSAEGFIAANSSLDDLLESVDAARLEDGEIQIEFIPRTPIRMQPAHFVLPS